MTEQKRRRWLSTTEVGNYLGVHPRTVQRLIRRGELPAHKIGGNYKISPAVLEAYLESTATADWDGEAEFVKGQLKFVIVAADEDDGEPQE